jgi:hypothetical protein
MFGVFNLRKGVDLQTFKQAFDAFCIHLTQRGYVHSFRVWKRAHHSGYDANFPDVEVMVEMSFHDHGASLACWDYVEAHQEPIRTLHIAVNGKVTDARFVLFQEVTLTGLP